MKKILLIMGVSLLLVGCGDYEVTKTNNNPTTSSKSTSQTTTTESTTTTTTTATKKTTRAKKTTKDNSIKVGNKSLKYGKYTFKEADLNATIVIKEDGTATYVGNVDTHGDRKPIDTTGTWKIKETSSLVFINFSWSNGTEEGYWIIKDSFSDQWHEFRYTK